MIFAPSSLTAFQLRSKLSFSMSVLMTILAYVYILVKEHVFKPLHLVQSSSIVSLKLWRPVSKGHCVLQHVTDILSQCDGVL